MIDSICQEISNRRDYLTEEIGTIYFGGGTPSLLETEQLEHLLAVVYATFNVSKHAEITLEANPEDLSKVKSKELYDLGINRLSLGIQTFDDEKLSWMNRAHAASDSMEAFQNARAAGFNNISLDLIYAIPNHDEKKWNSDLESITKLEPEHISLYGLTIESKTVFAKWEEQKKLIELPEEEAAKQYLFAIDFLKSKGYQQYEVSNFGRDELYSRHNTNYWAGIPYLGVGPGAHSYDGSSRRFNIRNNAKYISGINSNESYFESENLSATQLINERILTQLRTAKGLDLNSLESMRPQFENAHSNFLEELTKQDLICVEGNFISLKPQGFLVADEIALRLFFDE